MTSAAKTEHASIGTPAASPSTHPERDGLTDGQPRASLSDMAKTPPPLSAQIRTAIDGSGLSRRRICAEIGLDEASMSKFMAGQRGLSMPVLDRLGQHLGLVLRPVTAAKRKMGS